VKERPHEKIIDQEKRESGRGNTELPPRLGHEQRAMYCTVIYFPTENGTLQGEIIKKKKEKGQKNRNKEGEKERCRESTLGEKFTEIRRPTIRDQGVSR